MRDNGKIVRYMEKESSDGRIVHSMLASIITVKSMVRAILLFPMETIIKVFGKKANNMEKASYSAKMGSNSNQDNGTMDSLWAKRKKAYYSE